MLDIQNYKVRKEFEGYTIDCYSLGDFAYEINLKFDSEETAQKVTDVLNEEAVEAYGEGQNSCY